MSTKNHILGNNLFYTEEQLQAICEALNKIFWKIPKKHTQNTTNDEAEYIVAELADADILIVWNDKEQEFQSKATYLLAKNGCGICKKPQSIRWTCRICGNTVCHHKFNLITKKCDNCKDIKTLDD